jgi:hypothetical protein
MIRWFVRLLFESTPAEFTSGYGLAESVDRLRAATKRSVFGALGETSAVGKVSQEEVRLQRVIPMVSNSFKPFFVGRFEARNGGTVLTGRFGMSKFASIFICFWLVMVALIGIVLLISAPYSTATGNRFFMFGPLIMLPLGIAMVAFGKWLARNDIAWLSQVIQKALGATPKGANIESPWNTTSDSTSVPIPLKVVAIFLVITGLLALLAKVPALDQAAAGIQVAHLNIVYAVTTIGLAIGVWTRQPWAWWAGFLLLALSWGQFFLTMYSRGNMRLPVAIEIVMGISSAFVMAIWGKWWYAQRKHFEWSSRR